MSRAEPPRPTWFVLPGRGVTPGAVIGMGAALLAAGNRGAEDGRVWDLNDATGAFAPADPLRAPERWWARLYAVDGGAGVVPDPRGLAGYPGVEDALVLAELLDSAVVLTGGGPAGLRRLRAGGDLADLVDALWPPYRRLTAIGGGSAEERAVGSATQALVETARAVDAAMTDATRVRLHVVAEPADARRLSAAAALLGFSGLSASTPAGAVVPLADNAVTTDLRPTGGTGLDARYRFTVRLPVTERPAMARRDEYLVIDAVGVRHRLRLPSVLRRCIVTRARWHGGELTDGTLEVEFRPDPGQWPREDDGRRVAGRPHPREGGR